MRNGLVIVDAEPIFSLATIDNLKILNILFDDIKIPSAVWEEITLNKKTKQYSIIHSFFKNKRHKIKGKLLLLTQLLVRGRGGFLLNILIW